LINDVRDGFDSLPALDRWARAVDVSAQVAVLGDNLVGFLPWASSPLAKAQHMTCSSTWGISCDQLKDATESAPDHSTT
jgi:hypothetical protein